MKLQQDQLSRDQSAKQQITVQSSQSQYQSVSSKHGQGSHFTSFKTQEQYNNYISGEDVKVGGTDQIKKRNVVQQSSMSHNLSSHASASAQPHNLNHQVQS